jgi:hypothetical protein
MCRKRAEALLRRQQYLEDLMQEHGLAVQKSKEDQGDSDPKGQGDQPYFMSSPTYY